MGENRENTSPRTLPTLLGSASAGAIGRLICYPLDTIKARVQADTSTPRLGRSFSKVFDGFTLREFRSLYRGLGVSIVGSAPATCLYLTSYEISKEYLLSMETTKKYPSLLYLGSGILAEAFSCVLWVPVDVIKERMQVQKQRSSPYYYRNTFHAITKIMETEKISGLYRGYGATMLSFGPFSALYFMFYEQSKQMWQQKLDTKTLSSSYTLASAAMAGSLASLFTNPLDLVKLRLQVQRQAAVAHGTSDVIYSGVLDGLIKILRTEGFLAYFKGAGARVAFHTPSTAITMSLFENCKQVYEKFLQ